MTNTQDTIQRDIVELPHELTIEEVSVPIGGSLQADQ
jgi:hypothetical protein